MGDMTAVVVLFSTPLGMRERSADAVSQNDATEVVPSVP
jgi:hypothetical protein